MNSDVTDRHRISIVVDTDLKRKLRRCAAEQDMNISTWVRTILELAVEEG